MRVAFASYCLWMRLVLAFLAGCSSASRGPQPEPGTIQAVAQPQLELELELSLACVSVEECVVVLRNVGTAPASINADLWPGDPRDPMGMTAFSLRASRVADGKVIPFAATVDRRRASERQLRPGERVRQEFGLSDWLVDAGDYDVVGVYDWRGVHVESSRARLSPGASGPR